MKNIKRFNKHKIKHTLVLAITSLITNTALAANDNKAAINEMAKAAAELFEGGLLKIVIIGGGFAAMIYSIVSGFKPAPFLGGLGLIIFYTLFRAYTTSFFG